MYSNTNLCAFVFLVKEECASEEEEELEKDALVEEILQQGDTAIIYPEAPEDEQSPTETGGADENGNTPTSHIILNVMMQMFRYYYCCVEISNSLMSSTTNFQLLPAQHSGVHSMLYSA